MMLQQLDVGLAEDVGAVGQFLADRAAEVIALALGRLDRAQFLGLGFVSHRKSKGDADRRIIIMFSGIVTIIRPTGQRI
jgi:hypothetical protein